MTSLNLKTLGETLANLRDPASRLPTGADRLSDFAFAPNPGNLKARCYLPAKLRPGAPLVVALHGCIQNAAVFDHGAGWSALADRLGFALLFPEQQRINNPSLCFNWFKAEDMQRDGGELASIRAMVTAMVTENRLDPARVYAVGLSAGGAVTGALLAHYPEVFAAGAILAGAPFGVARKPPQAFSVMRARNLPDAAALQDLLEAATPHAGPWPHLSIWQGDADRTVSPANADAIVAQWSRAHRLTEKPDTVDMVDGVTRRIWRDPAGAAVIEAWSIPGMGHGAPLALQRADALGVAMPFMLDAGVSSTAHIARFFGLGEPEDKSRRAPKMIVAAAPQPSLLARLAQRLGLRSFEAMTAHALFLTRWPRLLRAVVAPARHPR